MKGIRFLIVALTLLFAAPAMAQVVRGEITDLSPEKGFITVKSEVMGLAGPEKRDIAFRIDERTLLNLCWGESCDSGLAQKGLERMKDFAYFDAENLSVIGKEVEIHYTDGTDRIEMVNIYAPVPTYYFHPVDLISVF